MAVTIDGTNGITVDTIGTIYPLVRMTAQNSTSGTVVDFTGIPSWVRRITFLMNNVSTSGTSLLMIQLGSTTFVTTGYTSTASSQGGNTSNTTGFIVTNGVAAADLFNGAIQFTNLNGNIWIESGLGANAGGGARMSAGSITLSGVLDRLRLTTVNGTDTFDAGSVNVIYEG